MKNGEFDFGEDAAERPRRATPPAREPALKAAAKGKALKAIADKLAQPLLEEGRPVPSEAPDVAAAARAAGARRALGAALGIPAHVAALDWQAIAAELDAHGCAVIPGMLTDEECAAMAAQYGQPALFRSRVVMAQHGFGSGEYQYFRYPLPGIVAALRGALYGPLAAIANRWYDVMQLAARFPPEHVDFLARCHTAGQRRPTPLLLQYAAGDYNCLHQDLYGEHVFPLQAALLLSQPGADFTGGEFVLTEQRPRMQSRAEVVPLRRGDMVIFPVSQRPVRGTRGAYRVEMRHGVSRLRSGLRHTLGVIFHDAT